MSFFVDDIIEFVCDFGIYAAKISTLLNRLTLFAQSFHHFTHSRNAVAVDVAHAILHKFAQRAIDIAVVQQIIGQFAQERFGINVETSLRAVPARICELGGHARILVLTIVARHRSHP